MSIACLCPQQCFALRGIPPAPPQGLEIPMVSSPFIFIHVAKQSRDLSSASYQNANTLERIIKNDIDDLANFELIDWGDSPVAGRTVSQRDLQIVVPNVKLTDGQIKAINSATQYGKDNGVNLIITVGY